MNPSSGSFLILIYSGRPLTVDKRKQRMMEWKSERDRKRQVDAKKYKNGKFIVKHVNHSPPRYLVANSTFKQLDTKAKNRLVSAASSRPMTRSYAKKQQSLHTNKENIQKVYILMSIIVLFLVPGSHTRLNNTILSAYVLIAQDSGSMSYKKFLLHQLINGIIC